MPPRQLLLIGGGHSHLEVVRQLRHRRLPDAALTLVSPQRHASYSGMLPGLVEGLYEFADANVELEPLVRAAGGRFLADHVERLNLADRVAHLKGGMQIRFDVASLDVGSTPAMDVAGARQHAIGIKPVDRFLAAWDSMQEDARSGRLRSIAVVGGGIGGIEVLFAMQARLRSTSVQRRVAFHLIAPRFEMAAALAGRLRRLLLSREVVLHEPRYARAVRAGGVELDDGSRVECDRILWATQATAAPWCKASGLACDAAGFVRVDDHLRSPSHRFVFAAGDCASQDARPHPRSGVYAVRQGPVLAANLHGCLAGEALASYHPQRRALALVATGHRRAIASWGALAVAVGPMWRWKDWIDRRFIARYRVAADSS